MVVSENSLEWMNRDVSTAQTPVLIQDPYDGSTLHNLKQLRLTFLDLLHKVQNSPQKIKPSTASEAGSAFLEFNKNRLLAFLCDCRQWSKQMFPTQCILK